MGGVANSLLSPITEELTKTLFAHFFAASALAVHTVFGVLEALTDARHSKRPVAAAVLAVVTHMVFGTVTVLVWRYFNILAGISASALLHMLWNSFVYDLVNSQRKD